MFIECTGTDLTKAKIVLNTMVRAVSLYSAYFHLMRFGSTRAPLFSKTLFHSRLHHESKSALLTIFHEPQVDCPSHDSSRQYVEAPVLLVDVQVTMFSEYCAQKFEVEPVEVIIEGKSVLYPDLSVREMEVDVSYVNGTIGVVLSPTEVSTGTFLAHRRRFQNDKHVLSGLKSVACLLKFCASDCWLFVQDAAANKGQQGRRYR